MKNFTITLTETEVSLLIDGLFKERYQHDRNRVLIEKDETITSEEERKMWLKRHDECTGVLRNLTEKLLYIDEQ